MSVARILPISAEHPEPARLAEAAAILRGGGLVAFPTETVYGLGANALDPRAVARIYSVKGRPAFNPVIAHVASVEQARALAATWPPLADRLAEAFWPGPLTLVVSKAAMVPDIVTAGAETIAIRVPAHPVALALIREAGVPLAAPSANRSTEVSPTTAEHVAKGLGGRVDLILDAGPTAVGIESTVLDLTGPRPRILRPGPIGRAAIEAVTGPLGDADDAPARDEPRKSPGMMNRHYAPRAKIMLFQPDRRDDATEELRRAMISGVTVGAMILGGELPGPHVLRMPDDPAAYARALYAALHQLDDLGCGLVAIEMVPDTILWGGVRDRLTRAGTPADQGATG
ncbi:MAG TPA: L-threonylcarbamoyladenylate synthase [Gemmatimonadales bacterium]|nr:L-threonylcarbamoyladenylate synthase [Gemmatimonadales bacterium]